MWDILRDVDTTIDLNRAGYEVLCEEDEDWGKLAEKRGFVLIVLILLVF